MTNIEEATMETEDAVACMKAATVALRDEMDRDGNVLLREKLLRLVQKYDAAIDGLSSLMNEVKGLKS